MSHADHLRKGENVTVWKSLLAGSFSGLIARFGTAPMDTIKIRLQIMPMKNGQKFGIIDVVRDMFRQEGLKGFWKGNIPGSIMYIVYGGVQFSSYSLFNNLLSPIGWSPQLHSLIVGALAGSTSSFASYPFDVLRTRFVADRNSELSSITSTIKHIWSEKGAQGFFKGSTSSMVAITLSTSIMFSVYESIKIYCDQTRSDNPPFWNSALDNSASSIGGVASKLVTFPLDTIRRRMVIGHSQNVNGPSKQANMYESYNKLGLIRIGAVIIKQEGIYALYKGVTMALFKSVPSTTISLYSYELFIKSIAG